MGSNGVTAEEKRTFRVARVILCCLKKERESGVFIGFFTLRCLACGLPRCERLRQKNFYEVRECPLIFASQPLELLLELGRYTDGKNFIG